MAPAPIVLNGRFLSAPPTGVQRVARQLVDHLDRLLSAEGAPSDRAWFLHCPGGVSRPMALRSIQQKRAGRLSGHAWEQFELPRRARGAVLVNLCNLSPLSHESAVTLIHDAQVFITPQSYSKAFVAWYRFALPRIGATAAKIVTVSDYSRDRLIEFGVARRENIAVIHNGVDHFDGAASEPGTLERFGLTRGRFVLAASSALSHKNLGVLFKAFESPTLADLRLVLVGATEPETFVRAGLLPPSDSIFAGPLSDSALRGLYENALCLAFPSRTEGFGLPPLEAMALGCPAVVSPCGALLETCGDAALYADPDDPAEWVRAIGRLADDADLRAALREAGFDRAARFRWEQSARALLGVIETVANAADARAAAK